MSAPDSYAALRKWAEAHVAPPNQAGLVQATQVLELLAERDDLKEAADLFDLNVREGRIGLLPRTVELPPCKTPGHPADCDCRWAATGEGGY